MCTHVHLCVRTYVYVYVSNSLKIRGELSKRGMFALFFATSELHTNCAPAQTAGTARESTQSAALQETHTQDATRNFGRPSSCDAVRMTFGFRPEPDNNAVFFRPFWSTHSEELFLMRRIVSLLVPIIIIRVFKAI